MRTSTVNCVYMDSLYVCYLSRCDGDDDCGDDTDEHHCPRE